MMRQTDRIGRLHMRKGYQRKRNRKEGWRKALQLARKGRWAVSAFKIKKAEKGEGRRLLQGGCGYELAFRYTVSGVL